MKKVFLDTNVLLDVLLERHPFCQSAQLLWSKAEKKEIQAAVSAISISNVYFIMKKLSNNEKAQLAVETLIKIFKIVEVNSRIIRKALKAQFSDFEDAIQYACALECKSEAIITRDPAGFKKGTLLVMECAQFLSLPLPSSH